MGRGRDPGEARAEITQLRSFIKRPAAGFSFRERFVWDIDLGLSKNGRKKGHGDTAAVLFGRSEKLSPCVIE